MKKGSALTMEKLDSSKARQFSVFLKNRIGALMDLVNVLQQEKIEILALSVMDSSEAAIVRVIVSDPTRVEELFEENRIAASTIEILVVELKEGAADLPKVLSAIIQADVNIHFCYPLMIRPNGKTLLALHTDSEECASSVLQSLGFRVLNQGDLSR